MRNGPIGKPERVIEVVPENEPVPQRVVVPDSPADLPARSPERVS
jgi:hypothetical protein